MWDVGGVPKLRRLWKHYFMNTQGLLYLLRFGIRFLNKILKNDIRI